MKFIALNVTDPDKCVDFTLVYVNSAHIMGFFDISMTEDLKGGVVIMSPDIFVEENGDIIPSRMLYVSETAAQIAMMLR